MTVDKDSLAPVMTYIERLEPEWQAVFAINLAKNKSKQALAFGNKKFAEWLAANQDLL
jgi:hypothetical protein